MSVLNLQLRHKYFCQSYLKWLKPTSFLTVRFRVFVLITNMVVLQWPFSGLPRKLIYFHYLRTHSWNTHARTHMCSFPLNGLAQLILAHLLEEFLLLGIITADHRQRSRGTQETPHSVTVQVAGEAELKLTAHYESGPLYLSHSCNESVAVALLIRWYWL